MQFNKPLLAAGLLLSLTTLDAEATLTAYTSEGQRVVYSSVSNITWTGNANLLGTMISNQGYNTVVNAIIAASPTINDTPNKYDTPANSGQYSVSNADFDSNSLGRTSWFGAQAFTNYLNSINYADSNQWALPSAGANPQAGHNPAGSQFAQLFYDELGSTAEREIPDTANFTNEQDLQVWPAWLGSEYAPYPYGAWAFNTDYAYQNANDKKHYPMYAWAISPGNVAAVPVPTAVWLFGSGLIGLLGWQRRGNIG